MTTYGPNRENEGQGRTADSAPLVALSFITSSLRSSGAQASMLNTGDDLFINMWEEPDAFRLVGDEDSVATQPVAAILTLPNGGHEFTSSLRAFMVGQSVELLGERGSLLMGGFTLYSELKPCSVAPTHLGIMIYKDGKVKVQHNPWARDDNADEAHSRLFAALASITDEVSVEPYSDDDCLFSTGWGRAEKFIDAWPAIFEAATNLP